MSEVEVRLIPWIGDRAARANEKPAALLVEVLRVDGEPVASDAELLVDGFVSVRIPHPAADLRERYTPDDYLAETTEDVLVLPVTRLEVVSQDAA